MADGNVCAFVASFHADCLACIGTNRLVLHAGRVQLQWAEVHSCQGGSGHGGGG